jgi:hypothetical protein
VQELLWMREEHGITSVQDCIGLANRFLWNMTVVHGDGGKVAVLAGEDAVFYADNMAAVEAFLYGVGLAYSIIPDEMAESLVNNMGFSDEELRDMGYNKAPTT